MIEELHAQIAVATERMITAEAAGEEREAHIHRARIDDLIEIAMRHGIDLKPWPDHPALCWPSWNPQGRPIGNLSQAPTRPISEPEAEPDNDPGG